MNQIKFTIHFLGQSSEKSQENISGILGPSFLTNSPTEPNESIQKPPKSKQIQLTLLG